MKQRARSATTPCAAQDKTDLDAEYLVADLASFAAEPERAGAFDIVFA